MKAERQESTVRRLGFAGTLLLFLLLFVMCCGVLACVFVRAGAVSHSAELYNASVTLCRSEAEKLRSGEIPEEGQTLYFDDRLQNCTEEKGIYCVTVDRKTDSTAVGEMYRMTISAGAIGSEPVYRLESTVYQPQEE